MSKNVLTPRPVPTGRYRFLAILFFIIAVAGLFLGYLGTYVSLFAHNQAVLDPFGVNIQIADGSPLAGTLFGYIVAALKYYFTGGFVLGSSTSIGYFTLQLLGLTQPLFLAVAVVASLALGVAACVTNGVHSRRLAMVSGYMVAIAYLWPLLTVFFFGMGAATPSVSVKLLGTTIAYSLDFPLLIIAGVTLLVLFVTTICRRKWIGFINVLLVLLLLVATLTFIYPTTATYGFTALVMLGLHHEEGFLLIAISYWVLIGLLAFNLVFAIYRLNAKRFYQFDAVRYGALFIAVVFMHVVFIAKNPMAPVGDRWYMFREDTVASIVLLVVTLVMFLLSLLNAGLIQHRRNVLKAKRAAAGLAASEANKAPANPNPVPPYGYPYPYPAPMPMQAPMQVPMGYGAPIILQQAPATPPVVVLQMPDGQAAPVPAPAPYYPPQTAPATYDGDLTEFERKMIELANKKPEAAPAEVKAETAAAPAPIVAKVQPANASRYAGPYDAFFATLTPDLQNEFGDLFIAKKNGDFGLPEYKIGGDNTNFFKKVFLPLGKYRPFISTELLQKLYEYVK